MIPFRKSAVESGRRGRADGLEEELRRRWIRTLVKIHVAIKIRQGAECFLTVTTGIQVFAVRTEQRTTSFVPFDRLLDDA